MTATQRSKYYDIWALRVKSVLPYDCWQIISQLAPFRIGRSFLVERLIRIHEKPIPRNHSLIEVDSAFGGAAVYNAKYLNKKCLYDGINEYGSWWFYEQCEHVSFHQCLRKNSEQRKIYINPQFQIF